jgi:allantoinase
MADAPIHQQNPRIPFVMSSERPKLPSPDGKPLIVHNVVNVEYWPFDQGMPRQTLTTPHGQAPKPDIPNYAWAEYGLRCGMPRLLRLYGERGLPVSCNINAAVIDVYPSLAEAMRDSTTKPTSQA